MLPDGFNPVSPSFTVGDVTTGLSGPQPTSCRTEMFSQLIDHWAVSNVSYGPYHQKKTSWKTPRSYQKRLI
ncbi:unnamed protein product [Schistosoma mattheei]|uniref:Uncharacterized protein n=1 Tax=Schistosoma mattheei TaxID=31246 RepID=A0A183PBX5_9TREM|nr:unnamed protein product [Schistosoma mattheei]